MSFPVVVQFDWGNKIREAFSIVISRKAHFALVGTNVPEDCERLRPIVKKAVELLRLGSYSLENMADSDIFLLKFSKCEKKPAEEYLWYEFLTVLSNESDCEIQTAMKRRNYPTTVGYVDIEGFDDVVTTSLKALEYLHGKAEQNIEPTKKPEDTTQKIETQGKDGQSKNWHNDDFTEVIWNGKKYKFNKLQQALSVEYLWKNKRAREKSIGEAIGSEADNFRLIHIFRQGSTKTKMHSAWGTMIVPDGRGIYALAECKKVPKK